MRKFGFVLAGTLAALSLGFSANAGTVKVKYALSGSVVAGGILPIGPPGTGGLTLEYSGIGSTGTTIVHGPVHVKKFAFHQPLAVGPIPVLFPDTVTGMVSVYGFPSAPGTLASSGGLLLGPISAIIGGSLHCFGATCTGAGFPASVTVPISVPLTGANAFALSAPGAATLGSSLLPAFAFAPLSFGTALTFAGFVLTATLSAVEISRVAVPEPTSFSLLGLGILGLAGSAWRVRRNRR
jgi:hypothetical protein